jgi:hypothetical protein
MIWHVQQTSGYSEWHIEYNSNINNSCSCVCVCLCGGVSVCVGGDGGGWYDTQRYTWIHQYYTLHTQHTTSLPAPPCQYSHALRRRQLGTPGARPHAPPRGQQGCQQLVHPGAGSPAGSQGGQETVELVQGCALKQRAADQLERWG